MDILKLARKLEPLMPNQVQHWLRIRDTADPELKTLIEKQIINSAYNMLGDFRSKTLLSLPPQAKAKGAIHFGTIQYEREKWPLGISANELLQNLAIFGRSGAGKTNVAFHILQQLAAKKIPFLFLDWKRTARHLLPWLGNQVQIFTPGRSISEFPFNPFVVPPGLEESVYINYLVDILADAYTLGDGVRSVLQKAIFNCYKQGNRSPTAADILREVEDMPGKGRAGGWKISVTRALESVEFANITGSGRTSQETLARSLLERSSIIELDALSQNSKKFLIPILCLWLYCVRLNQADREKLRLVIFVEEAHHIFYRQEHRAKESLMNMLLRQCREMGIAFVVIDQHPHLISSPALGNTYTSICMNQKHPSDINCSAALCLLGDSDKKHFSMLPVGRGIVKLQDRWRRPVLVQFPLVGIQKGAVTDALLKSKIRASGTLSALKLAVGSESAGIGRSRVADKGPNEDEWSFLEDVLQYPHDGVDLRYKRLGFSAGKGNRVKLRLHQRGLLESQEVPIGRTRRLLLRIPASGRKILGLQSNSPQRGSLAHEYWKYYYAQNYSENGYSVTVEAPRRNGRVDALAIKGTESIAIEIETGKSDVVSNVRQDLLSGFTRVLVVATDEAALKKIEEQLGAARLIISGRVILAIQGVWRNRSAARGQATK